jgi:hypothetical protein
MQNTQTGFCRRWWVLEFQRSGLLWEYPFLADGEKNCHSQEGFEGWGLGLFSPFAFLIGREVRRDGEGWLWVVG